ncbi:hypothetical protein ZWY2020_004923 [Hordeum vulgare]|nr:hypothetical protein ZWY2020_004923 [Hordeum vulgare]
MDRWAATAAGPAVAGAPPHRCIQAVVQAHGGDAGWLPTATAASSRWTCAAAGRRAAIFVRRCHGRYFADVATPPSFEFSTTTALIRLRPLPESMSDFLMGSLQRLKKLTRRGRRLARRRPATTRRLQCRCRVHAHRAVAATPGADSHPMCKEAFELGDEARRCLMPHVPL